MRILIIGAGAVGGYFGGRLAQAGRDVTFLVRPKRAEQIQAQGLRILSPYHGDFTVRPKTIAAAQIMSPYDIIFLSVKSYSLAAAIDDFAPAVGPGTVIIPVLNGMHRFARPGNPACRFPEGQLRRTGRDKDASDRSSAAVFSRGWI
jgi:2-dehydropantoate 2-reductase